MDLSLIRPTQALISAAQGKRFTPRAVAYIIDMLALNGITYAVSYGLGIVLVGWFYLIAPLIGRHYYFVRSNPSLLSFLVGFMETVIYFTVFEWQYGKTLGKVILRMQVVSSNGEACSLTQALTRAVYRLVDGLFLGLVAYENMKAPTYQRLGDRKAQTVVVSAADPIIKVKPAWWRFLIAFTVYLFVKGIFILLMSLPALRFVDVIK